MRFVLSQTVRSLGARLTSAIRILCAIIAVSLTLTPISANAQTVVEVVEYFIPALNKYFITGRASEKSLLDSNASFVRTGMRFSVFAASAAPTATSPICRFYIQPPGPNTHTYLGPADCALVLSIKPPYFVDEGRDFATYLPDADGNCPSVASFPVYRSFNRRDNVNDAGHRFTVDATTYANMAARGFASEGAVFCASAVVAPTLAMSAIAADPVTSFTESSFAVPAGSSPMMLSYQTLASVIKFTTAQIVSSDATALVVRGAQSVRVDDIVSGGGRFYKVTSVSHAGGNTTITGSEPSIPEVFASFELNGGIDVAASNGQASAFASAGPKALLNGLTIERTLDLGSGVSFKGSAKILKLDIISAIKYSVLSLNRPQLREGVLMTVRGSVELEGKLTVTASLKQAIPADSDIETVWGIGTRRGCFTAWVGGTIVLGVEVPVCLEARVDVRSQFVQKSIKNVTNFEIRAVRGIDGSVSFETNFLPTDSVTTTPPTLDGAFDQFITSTLGVYVAPRAILTTGLGTIRVFSLKAQGGVESELKTKTIPSTCTNATVNATLRVSYAAPLFQFFTVGSRKDRFREIVTLKQLISESKDCPELADGSYIGTYSDTSLFNIARPDCVGTQTGLFTGTFLMDVVDGKPKQLINGFTIDWFSNVSCSASFQEQVAELCYKFQLVNGTWQTVPDDIFCYSGSSYKITPSSTNSAGINWLFNPRNGSALTGQFGTTATVRKQ